jgi:hypothetical protein
MSKKPLTEQLRRDGFTSSQIKKLRLLIREEIEAIEEENRVVEKGAALRRYLSGEDERDD